MTKKEIVRRLSAELDVDQSLAKRIVQHTFDAIIETLVEEGRIELRNFGVFEVKVRAARKARNPKTNQQVYVPARAVVTFTPGKNVATLIETSRPIEGHTDKPPAAAPTQNPGSPSAIQ